MLFLENKHFTVNSNISILNIGLQLFPISKKITLQAEVTDDKSSPKCSGHFLFSSITVHTFVAAIFITKFEKMEDGSLDLLLAPTCPTDSALLVVGSIGALSTSWL